MKKLIKSGMDARNDLINGVNKVAEAVSSTLGPKASNVAIAKAYENPTVTHDGVTVAKNIILEDPFEDVGAQLVREAAAKTNDEAGDGTTTATVLAQSIIKEGKREIDNGANSQILKTELSQAVEKVSQELKKFTIPVKTRSQKEQVATISAANVELGSIIVDAIEKAGESGTVSINEFPSDSITIQHTQGMQFDRGFLSPYFITDDKNKCGIDLPLILITDQKLTAAVDLVPFLDAATKETKNLMVIADDVEGEALALLVTNRLKGILNVVAVKAPAFGLQRRHMLEDIAVLTGGTVIAEDAGRALNTITIDDLGRCDRVLVDRDTTLIVNGKGSLLNVERRVSALKEEIEETTDVYLKDQLKIRLAKLTNGVVVINVGGKTEVEMKENKFRIEDALNATQSAIEQGIVPGGETALLKASRVLGDTLGERVLKKACEAPFKKLLENAEITDGELIAKAMKVQKMEGIDVMSGKIVDMLHEGIIDPVKVTRSALKNAVSVAGLILTTKTLIVDKEENAKS